MFSRLSLRAADLFNEAATWLEEKYQITTRNFSPSSPYAQILMVLMHLTEMIATFLSQAQTEQNIEKAKNRASVYGLARLSGYNVFLGQGARGKMNLIIDDATANKNGLVGEVFLRIKNGTKLTINGIPFFIKTPLQSGINLSPGSTHYKSNYYNVEVYQGALKSQTFEMVGNMLESISVVEKKDMVDVSTILVTVNGEYCEILDSIYDGNLDSYSCVVKTGISGGVDVYFGDDINSKKVPAGATVKVEYTVHNGVSGNIIDDQASIKFIDSGVRSDGANIDLNKALLVNFYGTYLGCDSEDLESVRNLASCRSMTGVLNSVKSFETYVKRYNFFSKVEAFTLNEDSDRPYSNVVYLNLIPKLSFLGVSNIFELSASTEPADLKSVILDSELASYITDDITKSGKMTLGVQLVVLNKSNINNIINEFKDSLHFEKYNYAMNLTIKTSVKELVSGYYSDSYKSTVYNDLSTLISNKLSEEGIISSNFISRSDMIDYIMDYLNKAYPNEKFFVDVEFISNRLENYLRDIFSRKAFDIIEENKTIEDYETWEEIGTYLPDTYNHIFNRDTLIQHGLDEHGNIFLRNGSIVTINGDFLNRDGIKFERGLSGYKTPGAFNITYKSI